MYGTPKALKCSMYIFSLLVMGDRGTVVTSTASSLGHMAGLWKTWCQLFQPIPVGDYTRDEDGAVPALTPPTAAIHPWPAHFWCGPFSCQQHQLGELAHCCQTEDHHASGAGSLQGIFCAAGATVSVLHITGGTEEAGRREGRAWSLTRTSVWLFYSALFCAASLWALCVLLDTTEQKSHKTLRGCLKEGYKNGESLGGKTYEEELKTLVCLTWERGDWGETSSQSVGLLLCQGAGR